MSITIEGPCVYTRENILHGARVVIKNGVIHAIDKKNETCDNKIFTFPRNYHVLPGFIDMHVHGILGCDVMDGKTTSLETLCEQLPHEGTTGFLATTMTQSSACIEKALSTVAEFKNHRGAELLGVHLEGPFISTHCAGAQSAQYARAPDVTLFSHWQHLSNNTIKLITLAPELPGAMDFIRDIAATGVIVSIGHTDADMETTCEAINAGCCQGTHIFNAMRGLHHRAPGTVTPLLLHKNVSVEIIPDNIHVHPMIVDLIYRLKGSDGIMLVTDAMRAKCLNDGDYDLGGQTVTVQQGCARLPGGRLAGSVLRLPTAIQHMLHNTGCGLHDIMRMTSENPAKQLNIFHKKGSIAVGKDADLVMLDDKLRVVLTLCRGEISFAASSLHEAIA